MPLVGVCSGSNLVKLFLFIKFFIVFLSVAKHVYEASII